MAANNRSSGEKIIDVKRVVREEKHAQRINFYAALGISLLVIVILTVATALMMFMASASWYGPLAQLLEVSAVVALLGLFFCLPVLFASKYGWRTVVTTFLLQCLLIFLTVFIVSLFVADNNQSEPYWHGDIPYGGIELKN